MTVLLLFNCFLSAYVNNVPAAIAFPAKTTEQRGARRDHLHDFSVCDRGPIILEVGNTSIILYNLLGPKVGKLVKKKTLSHCPTPGATPSIFTMLHLNIPTKIPSMFQVCRLSGSKNWKFFKLPAKKKKIREKCFFCRYPFNFNNLRSAGVPNATHQIWKWSLKRFWRRSFFYHFQQNAPLLAPGAGSAPIFSTYSLLVAPMPHTKFQLNPPSGSGEEVENVNV